MNVKTMILLLILTICMIRCSEPQSIITHNGNFLQSDVTLSKNITTSVTFDGTINITNTITINEGVIVTFKPGTVIESDEDVIIEIKGLIMAVGTEDEPITFRSSNDSVVWGGFDFVSTVEGEQSIFDYCIITGANINFSTENNSRIKMTNTKIGSE